MLLQEKFFENRLGVFAVLLLPSILLYAKSLGFEFTTMDEQWMIVKNDPYLKTWKSVSDAFTVPLSGMYYRPLFLITIILDYQIAGLKPFIYHLSNILWHLISVLLLYRFLAVYSGNKRPAFIMAVIFSVHPVLLHAVAWIPGRNDSMLAAMCLASLILLKRYFDDGKPKFLVFHFLFFFIALLTKESAAMLPLLFILVFYIFGIKSARTMVILCSGWILLSLIWYFMRKNAVQFNLQNGEFAATLKNFIAAMLVYTGKALLPVKLSVFPTLKNSLVWPGIIALILIPGLYLLKAKEKKMALFGIALFVTMLVIPVWFSSISSAREHYEHRIYMPLAGMALFFCCLRFDFGRKDSFAIALLIAFTFGSYAFRRMEIYRNEEVFLNKAADECPDFYLFQVQKAEKLYQKGDYPNAVIYYTRAIEIRPDKLDIYNNRGGAYFQMGHNYQAVADFSKALTDKKFHSEYLLNRCAAYYAMGNLPDAMRDLVALDKCCKDVLPEQFKREVTAKWVNSELNQLNALIEKEPGNAEYYFKRANIWIGIGNTAEAVKDLEKAYSLNPDREEYLKLLLKKKGEMLGR